MPGRHVDPPRTAGEGDPSSTEAHDGATAAGPSPDPDVARPRSSGRRVLLIVAVAFVLVVALIVVYTLVSDRQGGQAEPVTPDPITTTLAPPTPVGEPIELGGDSPLARALPDVVLDHVLRAQEPDADAFADHRALEGWLLTYSAPGSDIDVHVLQWPDAADAVAFTEDVVAQQDLADGEGRRSGDVAVQGESAGRYEIGVLTDADEPEPVSTPGDEGAEPAAVPEPLGPGLAVWSNGTVAFVATGDAARLAQFYDNFPF